MQVKHTETSQNVCTPRCQFTPVSEFPHVKLCATQLVVCGTEQMSPAEKKWKTENFDKYCNNDQIIASVWSLNTETCITNMVS